MNWLKRNEWNLILATASLAFILGIIGLHQFLAAAGKSATLADLVYFTLRLFLFNYD